MSEGIVGDTTDTTPEVQSAVAVADPEFVRDWQQWQERRFAAASAPHGPASLALTYWFADETQREVADLPGSWAARDGRLIASGFGEGAYTDAEGVALTAPLVLGGAVAPGEAYAGDRIVRVFERDGVLALRVFDPANPGRRDLEAIKAFALDATWRLEARFEPQVIERTIELADGYQKQAETSGSIVFTREGVERRVTGTLRPDGISVVFGDSTNGKESYGFRFLTVPLPDAEGRTTIDFNRAFLPPCAFSDQFVCPLPTPENRLPVPIRAGERLPRR